MSFPVVEATLDRGTDARGYGGIYGIEVEAHMHEIGSVGDSADRLLHDVVHTVAVDFRHRVHLHTGLLETLLLSTIETADPDQCHIGRVDLGRPPADVSQLACAIAQQRSQGHAVNVARG